VAAKVLLLQPPLVHSSKYGVSLFPLGLAYVAANLLQEHFHVSILDCFLEKRTQSVKLENGLNRIGLSDKEICDRIKTFQPDAVGISIPFSMQFHPAVHLANLVRNTVPRVPIVAGGAHVSAAPESLNESEFDYLIIGEGERTLPELIRCLGRTKGCDPHLPGVFYRDQNHNFTNDLPNRVISDLDSLPFPSYDLIPLRKAWARRVPYANVIATRGCPYNCNFCSIHSTMGKILRKRPIENILGEITLLYHKYGVREIFFEDDNLTSDMTWAKKLFYSLSQQHIDIEIGVRNGIRADKVDKELLNLMKRAGCSRICFAPESGNQQTLDEIIDKRLKLEEVERAVMLARSSGLNVTCFFVIGLPGEKKEDIQKTINFAKRLRRLGCDSVDINCATPYPGTRLYAECIKLGYIEDNIDYSQLHTGIATISTPDFSAAEVMSFRIQALNELRENFNERMSRLARSFVEKPSLFTKRKIRRYYHFFKWNAVL
jgi:magnesium-protoporphyrin IX monomethyl ester (oxidative) cyclase